MTIRSAYLAAATIAGALLFLAGQALLPSLPDELGPAFAGMVEHRDRLMAARLLTSAGAFLLVPAVVGIALHFRDSNRGARLVLVATTLFGVATFSNAVSQAVEGYVGWGATAPGADPATGRRIVGDLGAGLIGIPIGFWSIPAFALGGLLLAAGLWRTGRVPTWLPITLAAGVVLAGAFAGRGYVVALTQAPFTVALVALGLIVWGSELPESVPDAVPAGARLS
ncbi:hypothetical protein [Flexivirga alba]|uniref:DUF4386 family protein n=1 Tax=Flexivirga alba TaxID=702742 RepID=A0ABW2AIK7_9MICO